MTGRNAGMTPSIQTVQAPKRTRATVLKDRVKVRLALDEAGPLIAEVLKENDIEIPGADWSRVFPHWLIATVDDNVIGCVMVLPAKPIGFCEFLHVKPSAGFKFKALAVRKLIMAAIATIYHGGSSYVAGMVDGKNQKFYGVLTKMGFVVCAPGATMIKRLR